MRIAQNGATPSTETLSIDPSTAQGTGGVVQSTAQQRQWLSQATDFLGRPEQQRDLTTAMRARASTHPAYCAGASFAPKHIDIAFDPSPEFSADGTMTRGFAVYRATMEGCSMPVILTVFVDAAPGMPLRFKAGVPGTTFADADLQEKASFPEVIAAARPLVPGCSQLAPVDTRLIGTSQRHAGTLMPWSENWLVAGCGRLVNVKLDFTPDHAANKMLVHADPAASRLLQAGSAGAVPSADAEGDARKSAPPTAGSPAGGKVVASATGTSLIPLQGAEIPGAKVAGTCLLKLREAASAPPDHAECLAGLPPRPGATIACSASRGQAQGRMTVSITSIDRAANSVAFRCVVEAQ